MPTETKNRAGCQEMTITANIPSRKPLSALLNIFVTAKAFPIVVTAVDCHVRKKISSSHVDGIMVVDSAEHEYGPDVYLWSGGRYAHEPIDD